MAALTDSGIYNSMVHLYMVKLTHRNKMKLFSVTSLVIDQFSTR